jgi:UDP-N-acetylmuramyl pentapeptide synthase
MYHKQLVQFINACKIKSVYLVGKQMQLVKNLIYAPAHIAKDSAELMQILDKVGFAKGDLVFFKASRGMQLDKVFDHVVENAKKEESL